MTYKNSAIAKTSSNIIIGIVKGTWNDAAKVASAVQARMRRSQPVKVYEISDEVFGYEVG